MAGAAIWNHFRRFQITEFSPWELSLRDPDDAAAAASHATNEHYLVVGQVIEIIPHPQLNGRGEIKNLGWNPEEVQIRDEQLPFECGPLVARAGGVRAFDPPNGVKFALSSASFVTADSPRLNMVTRRTSYFVLKSVLPTVEEDPAVRREFGSVDPSASRIPHSLCLHYVVRFSNGDVLCMRRDLRAAYHGGRWSFSGEEQLAEQDFASPKPCLNLFQRAFCEEVLALRDEAPIEERWRHAEPLVESMRLLSVVLEERIHNYALAGVYQLSCDPREFVALHNSLVNQGIGTRDREGECFIVKHEELMRLLVEGTCTASGMFKSQQLPVRAESFHPTSRYRIFRLLRAVKRGPMELDDYHSRSLRRSSRDRG